MTNRRTSALSIVVVGLVCAAAACARTVTVSSTASVAPPTPAGAATVAQRIDQSPRHGEWVMIGTGANDSIRAWVVYPERPTPAPVVLVVHEIFGVSTWIRGVADQLAANGYIAIAPDLIYGKVALQGDTVPGQAATAAVRSLNADDVHRQLEAIARYGMNLPAAQKRYGIVGFCWGGSTSFAHAVRSPQGLGAAVVYYGSSPDTATLARVNVPVLGLYGGDDARVNATVPPAESVMQRLGRTFEAHFFEGAGHGFLRQQDGRDGANLAASEKAWPLTVAFFRRHLGG
jgi:carboxymethylenebutenolidase